MKKCKTILALILAALMFAANTFAVVEQSAVSVEANPIQTRWTHTSICRATLSFSGTTANCSALVEGLPGTTRIAATIVLARKNGSSWTTVRTWTHTVSSSVLIWSGTQAITTGNTYRLTVTADVTRNGTTERVSNWVERSC